MQCAWFHSPLLHVHSPQNTYAFNCLFPMNVDTHVFAGQRCEDVLRRACVEVSHGIGMACWSVCVCVCVCVCVAVKSKALLCWWWHEFWGISSYRDCNACKAAFLFATMSCSMPHSCTHTHTHKHTHTHHTHIHMHTMFNACVFSGSLTAQRGTTSFLLRT
jgi:hypothetical protein